MKNSESIIDEYRDSDPEEQLHLFLDNPLGFIQQVELLLAEWSIEDMA